MKLSEAVMERGIHSRDLAARMPWHVRLVLRVCARALNRYVLAPVVLRARERGVIDSYQAHEILADFDPTQKGAVGLVTERRRA